PFAEYKPALDRPGGFLLVPAEEVTDKVPGAGPAVDELAVVPTDGAAAAVASTAKAIAATKPAATKPTDKPVHMGAINVTGDPVKPLHGATVVEVIRNNFRAIMANGERTGRPVLAHLNHPNFGWGVTADEMAAVVEERFFEVYNGHPAVHHAGDATRPGVERMWDLANTLRVTALNAPPLYGLASDDSHSYHVPGMNRATPGRGWVCVRAATLAPDALVAAMKAGEFYASSGVTLADVRYDSAAGTLTVRVEPDGDAKHTVRFVGTLAPPAGAAATVAPADVGVTLATVDGHEATYKLTGKELYVRAVVIADRPPAVPSFAGQMKQAWTQPVGWEKRAAGGGGR
ncbi:MAG: family phosphohydrolase, histidinol phosphatase, partial [Phycisphaerales bacterium]|nr:family phosphohydrolase, histidinol phosphatase [Phycisphaerales bacterium]